MQFVSNGPDVPAALLQAHEDGRVVFFCGAGISYAAGLPLFRGLVEKVYLQTGTSMNRIEESAFKAYQYDVTLGLLEARHQGGRLAVRSAMAKALKPDLRRPGALDTHKALLDLSRDRNGAIRLVTTNFDSIFEVLAKRRRQRHNVFQAPMLPVPKNSKWDGVVYLHGLLADESNDAALHRLVVTSGDFGLAYLTERWAARFVSELFRNYVVCFVGYGINDPVLRYMMDALAADRLQGERTLPAYAFGSSEEGEDEATADDWIAKGVQPILYRVLAPKTPLEDHSALPRTLAVWAKTYRAGSLGKEAIVVQHAQTNPSENTAQDDFVGRMLWALAHYDGQPARRFAELDPVPPLSWLSALSDSRFRHVDLARFGVPPHSREDKDLVFSLVRRPAPYQFAPRMAFSYMDKAPCGWDPVMFQLARWLVRHLNDPELLLWLVEQGPRPHPHLGAILDDALKESFRLETTTDPDELNRKIGRSPNAVAGPAMRRLWRFYLAGLVKGPREDLDVFSWLEHYKQEGLTRTVRLELRKLLSPRISMRRSWRQLDHEDETTGDPVRGVIDWELVLSGEHVHPYLKEAYEKGALKADLDALVADFEQLLSDALAVMVDIGHAEANSDRSYWDLPSIEPHWQNRGFKDWIVLIESLRDAWLAVRSKHRSRARAIAQGWFGRPFATFKRLALFAASNDKAIEPKEWVGWLLADRQRWLWASETMRECMRLLVLQGGNLPRLARSRLEEAILKGPPRRLYRDNIAAAQWKRIVEHSTWLRLAKLESSGVVLGRPAQRRLSQLARAYPDWRLAKDQSDEFSHWMIGTGDDGYEDLRQIDHAPRIRRELVAWLRKDMGTQRGPYEEDNWLETCRTRFRQSASALKQLANENVWPVERWRVALQAWGNDLAVASWRCLAPAVRNMPDEVFKEVSRGVAWWLDSTGKSVFRHRSVFFELCNRVLAIEHVSGMSDERPVSQAINHPVGHVTQALIAYWFKRDPNDDEGLPEGVADIFAKLCDISNQQFRHGRVILASRLIALFRVDRAWTEKHLLPLFDWSLDPAEAGAAWEGFLWSPRLYRPLLSALKSPFLATADHYADLGAHGEQFARFLTYAALAVTEEIKPAEYRLAISRLPQDGLNQVATTLSQAQEGAGAQREEYWRTRASNFWKDVWPKDRKFASTEIAGSLAILCIEAGDEFPRALDTVIHWLQPIQDLGYVLRKANQRGIAARNPDATLKLLAAIVGAENWLSGELRKCLDDIRAAKPTLGADPAFVKLDEYARSRNL